MQKTIPPIAGFPFFGWTEEQIRSHFEGKVPQAGDPVLIYNSQGGLHHYQLASIVDPSCGRQKRIRLDRSGNYGGASFWRSGRNCLAPKSQTIMLPPIPEIMAHISAKTDVVIFPSVPNSTESKCPT